MDSGRTPTPYQGTCEKFTASETVELIIIYTGKEEPIFYYMSVQFPKVHAHTVGYVLFRYK
jgi:hypothetical protein